jgi:hypothetical protein
MQREIKPAWLIRLAEELGGVGAGRGAPRNTDLRRSVSTAYYALFHRLALATARAALPNAAPAEVYGLARHISHASVKQVCSYIAGEAPPKHLDAIVTRLRQNPELSAVANVFVDLQQQREDADYNHLADVTRPGVLGSVARAKQAIANVDRLSETDDLRAFLSLVTLRTSIGR